MAEDLADYLDENGIHCRYMHSDIDALERLDILRELRLGSFDVLIGINLLREGLDLPEVALVAILDADKEGFLRSERSLIQTVGRAARNVEGKVIMYADKVTDSMQKALDETNRRREIQVNHNQLHNITPESIHKAVYATIEPSLAEEEGHYDINEYQSLPAEERKKLIKEIETEMLKAAEKLEFERAAGLRDMMRELARPPKNKTRSNRRR